MLRLSLIDTLDALAADLTRSFKNLNSGGCCVIAAIVGEHLKKYVPVRIAVSEAFGAPRLSIDDIRVLCDNNIDIHKLEEYGVNLSHVVIEFDYQGNTYHYDSESGCVYATSYDPTCEFEIVEGHLTVDEAKEFANESGWNPCFDRGQIPGIQMVVEEYFLDTNLEIAV